MEHDNKNVIEKSKELTKYEINDILKCFNLDHELEIFGQKSVPEIPKSSKTKSNASITKEPKKSLDELRNKSFLTITQMLDVINDYDSTDTTKNSSITSNGKNRDNNDSTFCEEASLNNDSTFCEEAENNSPRNKNVKSKLNLSRLNSLKTFKNTSNKSSDSASPKPTNLNKSTFFNSVADEFDDILDASFNNELFSLIGDESVSKPSTSKSKVATKTQEENKQTSKINLPESETDDVFEDVIPKSPKLDLSNFHFKSKSDTSKNLSRLSALNSIKNKQESRLELKPESCEDDLSELNNLDLSEFQFDCKTTQEFKMSENAFQKKLDDRKEKVPKNTKKRKMRSNALSFLDMEAVVSGSDDDDADDVTMEDITFVDNSFENEYEEQVEMTQKYLQSIRSPLKVGGFKIPTLAPAKHKEWDFTQTVTVRDDSNYEDSFVIQDEKIEYVHDLSELEILERKLRKNSKKRQKPEKSSRLPSSAIVIDSSSDEEGIIIKRRRKTNSNKNMNISPEVIDRVKNSQKSAKKSNSLNYFDDDDEVFEIKSSGEKDKSIMPHKKSNRIKPICTSPEMDEFDVIESSQNSNKIACVIKTSSDEDQNQAIIGRRKANFNKKTAKKLCMLSDTESDLEDLN